MFFSLEELKLLKAIEGKVLQSVFYHQWQNIIKPDYIVEFVEYVEFTFSDGSNILLTSTEDGDGLKVETEKISFIASAIKVKFDGQILINSIDVSQTYHWISSLEKKIKEVGIMSDDGNHFSNEAIIIDIEGLEFEILPAEEGLEVKTFEDKEEDDDEDLYIDQS